MFVKLLFVCSLLCAANAQQITLDVIVSQGTVTGQKATDGDYYSFRGIPYAGLVSGENRFKAAPPAPNFPWPWIASTIECAQPTATEMTGDENCLLLNIFTKHVTGTRPVFVWLMGEQYTTASYKQLNFRTLVESQDLLVVTINYRLSIFGFLCLGVEDAPGNAGLKDVIAGLEWIKTNIAAFSGDPNNVILAGHGSGAAMVDLVTLSPLAVGLVHKAIAQSGSSLSPWAVSYNPVQTAHAVGARLGFTGMSNEQLAKALQSTPLSLLHSVLAGPQFANNTPLFAPCIENNPSNGSFMVQAPINVLKSGQYLHIPFITGYTNKEGSVRAEQAVYEDWFNKMESNFEDFIQVDLNFNNVSNKTDIIANIKKFYFNEQRVNIETVEDYLAYHGDTLVLVSAIRTVVERAKTSTADVRLYEFGYIGSSSAVWPYPTIALTGARHGQELVYLFEAGSPVLIVDILDQTAKHSLLRRWGSFARTGIPTAASPPGEVEWPRVTNNAISQLQYVEVREMSIMENFKTHNIHTQKMNLWNDLYEKYYVAPSPNAACTVFVGSCVMLLYSLFVTML